MNGSATAGQPEYLRAWSLRQPPFEEKPDAQFFYAGSTLMQRLDLLTHLVQFSESIVVVSGPPGSGKSMLLQQFLDHINPQWLTCQMDGQQGEQLAVRLAETLGVSPGEDEQTLLSRWVAQSDPAQQVIIVLDNAEQLDASARRRLCELTERADGDRLRVVLFGTATTQVHIRATLEQLNSKHTCQTLELPRLTEEETAAYLMYRLAVAGYSGESPFTPTEVRAICKSADGRPGQINRLAHESLLEHHLRAKIKKRAPVSHGPKKNRTPLWVAASLLIAILAGYLGWQRLAPTERPDVRSTPPEQAFVEHSLTLPAEPAQPEKRHTGTEITGTVEPVSGEPAVPAISAVAPEAGQPTEATEELSARPPAPAPAPAPADDVVPPVTTAQPVTATPSPQQPRASLPVTAPAPAPTPAGTLPHREAWLLQQPPGTFTLQLLGSRDQASIENYIKRHALAPEKTAWYRGRYRGADWYVLLYGIYPDKAAALAARSALPARVQKAKPWPRTLKSVQNSINEVQ